MWPAFSTWGGGGVSVHNSQKVLPIICQLSSSTVLSQWSEKDSFVHVSLVSFIYSLYHCILCPGVVTGAEHTQIKKTKVLFLWFFSEEPQKQENGYDKVQLVTDVQLCVSLRYGQQWTTQHMQWSCKITIKVRYGRQYFLSVTPELGRQSRRAAPSLKGSSTQATELDPISKRKL